MPAKGVGVAEWHVAIKQDVLRKRVQEGAGQATKLQSCIVGQPGTMYHWQGRHSPWYKSLK